MFGRRFARRMARGFYQGEGFPWEQGEGPRGPEGPGFGPERGPEGPGFGPGRGPWGPGFGPGRGWGPGRGGFGPGRGWGPGRGPWQHPAFAPEMQALRSTAGEVARLFAIAGRNSIGNPEKQAQLRAFLEKSRKELLDIIGTSESAAQNEAPPAE